MKKLLATMLSLALLASTFVVASADGNPYATATAKPVSAELYNAVMEGAGEATLPEGASAYEVTLDLNNLPDLLWGNLAGSTGVRFGSSTFDIYFDELSNVASVFALGSDIAEYELGAEKYGRVAYAASINNIKNAVSVVYTTTGGAKEAYPSKKADQDYDADGKLADTIVLYVVTTAPATIESIVSDITIYNKGTTENTQETKSDLNVTLGEVAEDQTLGYETTLAYDGTSKGFQFVATNTEKNITVASEVKALPTVENLGDVKLGCNIVNIPADKDLDDVKSVLSVFARWVAEVPVTE